MANNMNKYEELNRKNSVLFDKYNSMFNEQAIQNKFKKHQVVAMYNQLNLIFKTVLKKSSPFLFRYESEEVEFKHSMLNEAVVISFPVITYGGTAINIRPQTYPQNTSTLSLICNNIDSEALNSYFKLKYDTLEKDEYGNKCWQLKADPDSGSCFTKLDEYAVKRILSFVIRNHTDLEK